MSTAGVANPVCLTSAHSKRGISIAAVLVVVATGLLYATDTDTIIVASCALGGTIGLVPIARRCRRAPPANQAELMALSRHAAMYFHAWLVMMAIYLVVGTPFGIPVLEVITGACLSAMFFRRLVFPGVTLGLWHFNDAQGADRAAIRSNRQANETPRHGWNSEH